MKLEKYRFAMVEILVALAVITIALVPLAMGFKYEIQRFHSLYYRSVAEQVLDGYREVLVAGEWQKYPEGKSEISIKNFAFDKLPPGKTFLHKESLKDNKKRLTLSWQADDYKGIGTITKEVIIN